MADDAPRKRDLFDAENVSRNMVARTPPPVMSVSHFVSFGPPAARAATWAALDQRRGFRVFTRRVGASLFHAEGRDRAGPLRVLPAARRRRSPSRLREGLAVEVRATPSIYEARGEFQLNVETVRLAGLGALYERFLQLKAALAAAGLFDAGRKRALPRYPRRIGIVTSRRAAALRDVLTTLARRFPLRAGDPVSGVPCRVRARRSEIAAAIRARQRACAASTC